MVISLADFNNLSEKDKKKTMQEIKSELGVGGLAQEWGISRSKLYSMLHALEIPVQPRKPRKNKDDKQGLVAGKEGIKPTNSQRRSKTPNVAAEYITGEALPQSHVFGSDLQLNMDLDDDMAKFYLHLETQGTASIIGETLQSLLKSGQWMDSSFHLDVTLRQV